MNSNAWFGMLIHTDDVRNDLAAASKIEDVPENTAVSLLGIYRETPLAQVHQAT